MPPDFFDKLFHLDLPAGTPTYAIQGVASVIWLYANGDINANTAGSLILDSEGNPVPPGELADAQLLLTNIDNAVGVEAKLREASKLIAVLNVVELGWTDKQTAKNFLGL